MMQEEKIKEIAESLKIDLNETEIRELELKINQNIEDLKSFESSADLDCAVLTRPYIEELNLFGEELKEYVETDTIMKNAPKSSGQMIEVPVMIND